MREIEVGCKIPESGGMEAFGVEEVNDLISKGWRVVSIKGKGALMRDMPLPRDREKMWGFIGFAMMVRLDEPEAE